MGDKERREIARKYYRNLSDIIIEVIKVRHMSKKQILNHFSFNNLELLDELAKKNKSVIGIFGHYGNWEWLGPAMHLVSKQHYKGLAIVKPLSDKRFDKYMTWLRERHLTNGHVVHFKQTYRTLVKYRDILTLTLIAADQIPHKDEINYWSKFLNQETAFFLGTEKIAKNLDIAVVYIDIQRVRRGYYEATLSLITDKPKETADFVITEKYIRKLEQAIIIHPDNWLWSHRRWKYRKADNL
jgi:KDO2-lipid IV(A) lauroyltransferase